MYLMNYFLLKSRDISNWALSVGLHDMLSHRDLFEAMRNGIDEADLQDSSSLLTFVLTGTGLGPACPSININMHQLDFQGQGCSG